MLVSSLRWVAVTVFLLAPAGVTAIDGALDPSFGEDGVVTTDIGEDGAAIRQVVTDGSGRIVVVGEDEVQDELVIVRHGPDGALDPEFGSGGLVRTQGRVVALQSNGALLVAADSRVRRLDPHGEADPTFGEGGSVAATATILTVAPDDSFLAADGGEIRRYLADGTVDSSFGDTGVALLPFDMCAGAIAMQHDGRIVVGDCLSPSDVDVRLTRLDAGGCLDRRFGTDGLAQSVGSLSSYTSFGNRVVQLHVVTDGAIIAAWDSCCFSSVLVFDWGLIRFTADGALDEPFGAGGAIHVGGGSRILADGFALAVDAVGRFTVGRVSVYPSGPGVSSSVLVERYTADGTLDPTFQSELRFFNPPGLGTFGALPIGTAIPAFDLAGRLLIAGSDMPLLEQSGSEPPKLGPARLVVARLQVSAPQSCPGDCNDDGEVSIDELLRGVNLLLGIPPASPCSAFDRDGDGSVSVAELVGAVHHSLAGCSE